MQQLNLESGFTFQEEGHIYTLNGKVLPHVTGILDDLNLTGLDKINPALLNERAQFGSKVHRAIAAYERDEDLSDITPEIFPYLNQYQLFKDTYGIQTEEVEFMGYSDYWKFAFTIDQVGTVNKGKYKGKRAIVDYKTGSYKPSDRLQIALYEVGWLNVHPNKKIGVRIILELTETSFKPIFRVEEVDKQAALAALIIWQWMKENRLI